MLEGLIHPIRRAPDDILQYIFEWVCILTEKPRWGEPFSQVSRRWRKVAISTPSAWKFIQPPLTKGPSIISEYWNMAAERVKSIPAIIRVHRERSRAPANLSGLHLWCPLTIFPNIKSLYIGLNNETTPHIISWLYKTSKTVDLLHFFHTLPHNNPTFKDICAIASLVRPNILEYPFLDVTLPTLRIEEKDTLPTVKTLRARLNGSTSALPEYFRTFPSLVRLRLWDCNLRDDGPPSPRIDLKHLKHLEIDDCRFPKGLPFNCSSLESLHIIESPVSLDFRDWIQIHKNIRQILIKASLRDEHESIAPTLSDINQLMERVNDSQCGVRTKLTLRLQLFSTSDAAEGAFWTEKKTRLAEYIWS